MVCRERSDKLGQIVKSRLDGLIDGQDLHAADARYHSACKAHFFYNHEGIGRTHGDRAEDPAFLALVAIMSEDRGKVWNSVELQQQYEEYGGTKVTQRRMLVDEVCIFFGDAVVKLSSPGLANIVVFKSETTKLLHLHQEKDDDLDAALDIVASCVKSETLAQKQKRDTYKVTIDYDVLRQPVSETFLKLLGKISNKFTDCSLSALLLANIVAGTIQAQPTDLQISLGVALRRNTSIITLLNNYRVCCSYDEVKLFKYSAAVAAVEDMGNIKFCCGGSNPLLHVIADNFDTEIWCQNCKKLCHSLTMVLAQTEKSLTSFSKPTHHKTIKRQPMESRTKTIEYNTTECEYTGPKKPPMPINIALKQVPPLSFLANYTRMQSYANDTDFKFTLDVLTDETCPEWNGYNTRQARQSGRSLEPQAKVVYLPLINMTPSHPTTIKTGIERGLEFITKNDQEILIFTVDQQLYKVTIDIMFNQPSYFEKVVPILGPMHNAMAFIHAICILMIGIKPLLASTFGSVDKMMSGKKYPQNFRALRMIAEEVLRPVIENNPGITSMGDLKKYLAELSNKSKTAKLWTDCLIKPVYILMSFLRAAHENEHALQIASAEAMLPYFMAAGCYHYARYGTFYVHHMRSLSPTVLKQLQHDCSLRRLPGYCNGIPTDQFIETTYMRLGHGPGGATGLAINERHMTVWALSFATCGELVSSLHALIDGSNNISTCHKEESSTRIAADQQDRRSLRRALSLAIDPLDPEQHPEGNLLNIVTGELVHTDINVYNIWILESQCFLISAIVGQRASIPNYRKRL